MQKQKKLLYIGVRNSYCYICTHARSKNVEPPDHTCYKNWGESSQAMEGDIIGKELNDTDFEGLAWGISDFKFLNH